MSAARRIVWVMLAMCGFCGSACVVVLAVPPDTQVACKTTQDCPQRFTCRQNIGRCVRVDGDSTPPNVRASSLVPASARIRAGQPLTISLTASEPLAFAPTVELVQAQERIHAALSSE